MKRAFEKLITGFLKVSTIQSDYGTEFNKIQCDFKVLKSKSHTPQTQGLIERFNGILSSMINKHLTYTGNKQWVSSLNDFVSAYNSTVQKSSQETPNGIVNDIEYSREDAADKIINDKNKIRHRREKLLSPGDRVRVALIEDSKISKAPGYSKEISTFDKVFKSKMVYFGFI